MLEAVLTFTGLRLSLLPATSRAFFFFSVDIKHRRSGRTVLYFSAPMPPLLFPLPTDQKK